ncbi:hypothetical protein LR48_Vigan06g133400 [Vigna angularis]|uniref:Uncharacterized protein n=1 Tax=Phaseolus angularis TaxID=3914 RepID=A0A0L9UTG2_PHAAN|nr:hypothetical protein LR48_Vigan06g133400 [Vigna angularis]
MFISQQYIPPTTRNHLLVFTHKPEPPSPDCFGRTHITPALLHHVHLQSPLLSIITSPSPFHPSSRTSTTFSITRLQLFDEGAEELRWSHA